VSNNFYPTQRHKFQYLYTDWIQHNLLSNSEPITYFKDLLKKHKSAGNPNASQDIKTLLQHISLAMAKIDTLYGFSPVLIGSMAEGTKVGPCDEYDFLLQLGSNILPEQVMTTLSVAYNPSAPHTLSRLIEHSMMDEDTSCIHKLYATLRDTLNATVSEHQKDCSSSRRLRLLGFTLNSSGLPCMFLHWQTEMETEPILIKVDIVPGIPLTRRLQKAVAENDPHGNKITAPPHIIVGHLSTNCDIDDQSRNYYMLSACLAEQVFISNLPHIVKDGLALTKMLTSCTVIPIMHECVHKVKISSYALKNCLFSAIALGKIKVHDDRQTERDENQDINDIIDIVKEIGNALYQPVSMYFLPEAILEFDAKAVALAKSVLRRKSYFEDGSCRNAIPS
jgi:hypothetical protein